MALAGKVKQAQTRNKATKVTEGFKRDMRIGFGVVNLNNALE